MKIKLCFHLQRHILLNIQYKGIAKISRPDIRSSGQNIYLPITQIGKPILCSNLNAVSIIHYNSINISNSKV